jgi:hypothetical protein
VTITSSQTGAFTSAPFLLLRRSRFVQCVADIIGIRNFGVIFNYRSLRVFKECVVRYWRQALGKRSQKGRMNWAIYPQLLIAFPLPEPAIHQAWLR